jgi:nucleotide-binding universal stress UspA family protein
MTIVCGTDFSEGAIGAGRVAAAIARRLGEPLELVHGVDELGAELVAGGPEDAVYDVLRLTARRQAEALAAEYGVPVEATVRAGHRDAVVTDVARERAARLVVVSSLGQRKQHRWLLGSVAERIAQASPAPVLVVRAPAVIEAWARGERTLHVLVAVEPTPTSRVALAWACALGQVGPCDLDVVQLVSPAREHERLGVVVPAPGEPMRPEVEDLLVRDLEAWAGPVDAGGRASLRVSPAQGRAEVQLSALASTLHADLVVVGSHRRAGVARLWHGSVSRGVLHLADTNVACIPRGEAAEHLVSYRRVLVATDFSALANRAVPYAYALVGPGGVVHLVHVQAGAAGESGEEAQRRLRALVPADAVSRGVETVVEVSPEPDAAAGIVHLAHRIGVDATCMATHGRSPLAGAVLGSQAQAVVQRASRPVLLIPPEPE